MTYRNYIQMAQNDTKTSIQLIWVFPFTIDSDQKVNTNEQQDLSTFWSKGKNFSEMYLGEHYPEVKGTISDQRESCLAGHFLKCLLNVQIACILWMVKQIRDNKS